MTFISITKANKNYLKYYNNYLKTQIHPLYKSKNKYSFSFKIFNILIHITNCNYVFNIDPDINEAQRFNTNITNIIYTLKSLKIYKQLHLLTTPQNFIYY